MKEFYKEKEFFELMNDMFLENEDFRNQLEDDGTLDFSLKSCFLYSHTELNEIDNNIEFKYNIHCVNTKYTNVYNGEIMSGIKLTEEFKIAYEEFKRNIQINKLLDE